MSMDPQSKIALDVRIAQGMVRLCKSRVSIFADETPLVRRPNDLRGRYNPVPLLTFLAHCKLRFLENKEEPFQARSASRKWVIQLYDLIKNCGKRETCWLEKVFGSHRTTPNVCAIHKVVTAFKEGHEHVVALAATAPRPDQIELSFDGAPAESEDELHEFLRRLGGDDEMATLPDSAEIGTASTTSTTTPPSIAGNGDVDQFDLPEHLRGQVSLRFPKFNLVHHAVERESLRRLAATRRLEVKWLSIRMEYGDIIFPDLLRTLVESVSECDITVSVAMLNPDWEYLEYFHPEWPNEARKIHHKLNELATQYREQQRTLKKRKVNIVLHEYEYVPNWHGVVLDDSRFYIGHCSWKEAVPGSGKKRLSGGENPYMLLCAENGGFESWLAKHFLSWFDYAFNWSSNIRASRQAAGRHR
jgi:hypothetical protein